MSNTTNIYQDHGYADRNEYLRSLTEEYGVDEHTVFSIAEVLGENEDFDGLVTHLEDISCGY